MLMKISELLLYISVAVICYFRFSGHFAGPHLLSMTHAIVRVGVSVHIYYKCARHYLF